MPNIKSECGDGRHMKWLEICYLGEINTRIKPKKPTGLRWNRTVSMCFVKLYTFI